MPEVAQVTDPDVVDLDQVHGVSPVLGALLSVVIGGKSDDADTGNLVLAGSADLVRIADCLRVVVIRVLVADGDQVGFQPLQFEPDRRWIWIGDDRGVAAPKPEAAMSQPGDVQYQSPLIKSWSESPPTLRGRARGEGIPANLHPIW